MLVYFSTPDPGNPAPAELTGGIFKIIAEDVEPDILYPPDLSDKVLLDALQFERGALCRLCDKIDRPEFERLKDGLRVVV